MMKGSHSMSDIRQTMIGVLNRWELVRTDTKNDT